MGKLTEIGLYKPNYQLYRDLIKFSSRLPKDYRFSIGDKMIQCSIRLTQYIAKANASDKIDKSSFILNAISELEVIRLNLRLLVDLRLLSEEYSKILFEYIESISKQLTGWNRSLK